MRNESSTAVAVFTGALMGAAILAVTSAAHAQASATTTSAATIVYDIPAGPLAAALNRVADMAGLTLVYPTGLAEGVRTRGLSGRHSAREALDLLLAGTGLKFEFTQDNTVRIEKVPEQGARVLAPVRVEGAQATAVNGINGSRDVTATEGTGSFTTDAMTVGSKTPRSIKDTPQSVSVITQERMRDQNLTDFTKALNQAPGVTLVTGGSSGVGVNQETAFYSRGFIVNSIQVDGGAPLATGYGMGNRTTGYFPLIDLSQYDHVELLRGATGLFNGYGNPSGTVNLVRKKPLDHGQVIWESQAGSWQHYRAMIDGTGPLSDDGRLRARAVVTYQDNEHFYARAEDNKTLIYGVLDYDLSPITLLSGGLSSSRQDSVPWRNGLQRFENGDDLNLPRDFSFVFPWNRWDTDTTELFARVEQRLGDRWQAKLNLTRNVQSTKAKIGYAVTTINPETLTGARLRVDVRDYSTEQLSAEATLSGSFEILGQTQNVLLGVNRVDTDGSGQTVYEDPISANIQPYQPYPGGPVYCVGGPTRCPPGSIRLLSPPIDPYHFDPIDRRYVEPPGSVPANYYGENGQVQTGAYLNVELTAFDRWHFATGVRWSRYEHNYHQENYCTSGLGCSLGEVTSLGWSQFDDEDFSWPPAVSLSYDVTGDILAYVGYADIYQSQATQLTRDGSPIDPVTGTNMELGVKWQARDGQLNASVSVYRIEQEGFATLDPSVPFSRPDTQHTCCYVKNSDQTLLSEGVDAEISGALLPGWQFAAGYTFSRNERKGSYYETSEGQPFTSRQPEHLLKLWTTYDLGALGSGRRDWVSRLSLSAGVNWQSSAYFAGRSCVEYEVLYGASGNPFIDAFGNPVLDCSRSVNYDFTQAAYAVWSARVRYELNKDWIVALNAENITDTRYYQTITNVEGGNWYGAPRSFMLTVRGIF